MRFRRDTSGTKEALAGGSEFGNGKGFDWATPDIKSNGKRTYAGFKMLSLNRISIPPDLTANT